MRRLPVTPGHFEEFEQALTDDGVAYLSEIEPGEQLRELAAGLGTCVEPGVGMPDGMHDGHSYLLVPEMERKFSGGWKRLWKGKAPTCRDFRRWA